MRLNTGLALQLARLPLAGLLREYPHADVHLMNGPEDARTPRELHPAFFGCFDWHSSVHGHWTLVRLLKEYEIPFAWETMRQTITAENIAGEVAYMEAPGRAGFERMYGWAWLLRLVQELRTWDLPEAQELANHLKPLEELVVRRYLEFLPKQEFPIRIGTHTNTAFGLAFAHDYAAALGNQELRELVERRSLDYFSANKNYPAHFEPGGADFLSPCLVEADLMARVLPRREFREWYRDFLPEGLPDSLRRPVGVSDRSDGQLGHLDGLNLSRAWCLAGIGSALNLAHELARGIPAAAMDHLGVGATAVGSGDYNGDHWLATFLVYILRGR